MNELTKESGAGKAVYQASVLLGRGIAWALVIVPTFAGIWLLIRWLG